MSRPQNGAAEMPSGRLRWQEGSPLASGAFPGKAFRWLDGRARAARLTRRPFGQAQIMRIHAPPVEISQDGPARDANRFHLVLHVDGHGRYLCPQAQFAHTPGDVVLLDAEQACRAVHPSGARIVRWSLPESALEPFIGVPGRISAHRLGAEDAMTGILAHNMRVLARRHAQLDAQAQSALVAHLCGLAGMALDRAVGPCLPPRRHLRTLQRQRILTYIEIHLRDPRLSARRAAEDLGMSTRWLHALLQDSPTGFAEIVASHRLDRCMAWLRDPAHAHVSIAEIAFAAGFNDLSTFYRRFRSRYDASPGSVRPAREARLRPPPGT